MQKAKTIFRLFLAVIFLMAATTIFFKYYSYLFSRHVVGIVESVERVQVNISVMQQNVGDKMNPGLFSFSVAIRLPDGEIVTASAEDRQWAVVQKGICAEATFYPYPPWEVMKGGTYFNARLDKLYDCPK